MGQGVFTHTALSGDSLLVCHCVSEHEETKQCIVIKIEVNFLLLVTIIIVLLFLNE